MLRAVTAIATAATAGALALAWGLRCEARGRGHRACKLTHPCRLSSEAPGPWDRGWWPERAAWLEAGSPLTSSWGCDRDPFRMGTKARVLKSREGTRMERRWRTWAVEMWGPGLRVHSLWAGDPRPGHRPRRTLSQMDI